MLCIRNNRSTNAQLDEIKIESETCIICFDERNQILEEHPCPTCAKNAWHCCDECISQLDKCPVCRKDLNNNLDENIHENNDGHIDEHINGRRYCHRIIERYHIFLDNHPRIDTFWGYLEGVIIFGIVFFYLIFIGKVMVYIYCTCNCNKKDNREDSPGCDCYHITEKENYWTDIMHNFSGSLGAGIIGNILLTIIYRLKCCNNRNN